MNLTYTPIARKEVLTVGTGNTIIFAGWYPVPALLKILEPKDYACIGPLYNQYEGLTTMVVNLLANPYKWNIIFLGATQLDKNAPATKAGYKLLQGDYTVVDGKATVLDDFGKEIGQVADFIQLEVLTKLTQLKDSTYYANSVQELRDILAAIENGLTAVALAGKPVTPELFAEPVYYDIPVPDTKYLPGSLYAPVVEGNTIAEAWVNALYLIRKNGRRTPSHYGERQELIALTSVIHNEPSEFHFTDYLPKDTGTSEYIEGYLPTVLTAEGVTEGSYTYGSRLTKHGLGKENQIVEVAKKLASSPDSTQLVLTTWDVSKDLYSVSPPCLTEIWLRVVEGTLVIEASFRSHDIYKAYTSNLMAIRRMQDVILEYAKECNPSLELIPGVMICHSKSAHIYSWGYTNVDEVINTQYGKQRIDYADPVGNFIIEIKEKESKSVIAVTHTSPEKGESLVIYEGLNPLKLMRRIATDNPRIQPAHMGYLGGELTRAAMCLIENKPFTQDERWIN
mgnify:CR=1 FL=1